MRFSRLATIALLTTFMATPVAHAQRAADECRQKTNYEVAREHRLYRSYLFGKRNAEDAPVGDVRYDTDGWAWIKRDSSSTPWQNSNPDNQGLRWSNSVMDENDEHADILPLIGIFETKRTSTSELIPYLLHSIRALDCRLKTLCEISRLSETESGSEPEPVDISSIQVLGCIEFTEAQTWPECHFESNPDARNIDQGDTRSYCESITQQLMDREMQLLKLVVEYDAGFRSLLQLAGNFDIFLREFRWPLSVTVRQAVELIGQLGRIPCFLSSCDAALPVDTLRQ